MKGKAATVICSLLLAGSVGAASAQPSSRGTRPPLVTAESESWYSSGTPITFAGQIYYLAGPRVHFIPSEMVRSGDFRGIPLYARTTIEPYSVVFVPVGGGLMQPYERRRTGELAGTVGSTAPSFPVALSSDRSAEDAGFGPQAAAPPALWDPLFDAGHWGQTPGAALLTPPGSDPGRAVTYSAAGSSRSGLESVGTTGVALVDLAALTRRRRAESPNAIFFQYDGVRWFTSGSPLAYDAARFIRAGEKDGFPVYRARRGQASTIYVPVAKDASDALAPYTRRTH